MTMNALAGSLRLVAKALGALLAGAGRLLRAGLSLLLALVLLFEEWGWRPLVEALGWLARFRLWARIEGWIAGLPPYGALVVFALPTAILLPVKLGALFLLAQGKVLMATAFLAMAKLASTAIVARIFLLTRPALMRLAWFARLYNLFMPWKEALQVWIRASWAWRYGRMLKGWVAREVRQTWRLWRPRLQAAWTRARAELAQWKLRARTAVLRGWRRMCVALRR